MSSETVLHARSLTIDLFTKSGALRPVDGVSYSVGRGETLAIVGESGSGKTVMSFAPFGLMPMGVEVGLSGSLIFEAPNWWAPAVAPCAVWLAARWV